MPNPEERRERHERQSREVEQSQQELRDSIAHTEHLLTQWETMLNRHRRECDEADD